MQSGFLIGAPSSGCGKTTFTMGLLRALMERGLQIQPYKCGPDFIDTLFHRQAAHRESVNLDTFMASEGHVREVFYHYGEGADVCVVEGAMGLLDGYDRSRGSAAEVARLLGLPVVLVVDAKPMAYSLAPLLQGFKSYMPLAGVVLNRVASDSHYGRLREACEDVGVACLGWLPANPSLRMPSRYLGLTLSGHDEMERFISLAAEEVKAHIDIDALLSEFSPQPSALSLQPSAFNPHPSAFRIAIASDEAFNFTYRANIDALVQQRRLEFFSPLRDEVLPPCDLLYLPGGYPELFARELSANVGMRRLIRDYVEGGGHVVAECGGMMYLCQAIDGAEMCGVLPFWATMEGARLHLGYRQMEANGMTFRGHEFHYSSVSEGVLPDAVRKVTGLRTAAGTPVATPVWRYKNVVAGYTLQVEQPLWFGIGLEL